MNLQQPDINITGWRQQSSEDIMDIVRNNNDNRRRAVPNQQSYDNIMISPSSSSSSPSLLLVLSPPPDNNNERSNNNNLKSSSIILTTPSKKKKLLSTEKDQQEEYKKPKPPPSPSQKKDDDDDDEGIPKKKKEHLLLKKPTTTTSTTSSSPSSPPLAKSTILTESKRELLLMSSLSRGITYEAEEPPPKLEEEEEETRRENDNMHVKKKKNPKRKHAGAYAVPSNNFKDSSDDGSIAPSNPRKGSKGKKPGSKSTRGVEAEEEVRKSAYDNDTTTTKKPKKSSQLLSLAPGAYNAHFQDDEEVYDNNNDDDSSPPPPKRNHRETRSSKSSKKNNKKESKSSTTRDDDDDDLPKKQRRRSKKQQQQLSLAPGAYYEESHFQDEEDVDDDDDDTSPRRSSSKKSPRTSSATVHRRSDRRGRRRRRHGRRDDNDLTSSKQRREQGALAPGAVSVAAVSSQQQQEGDFQDEKASMDDDDDEHQSPKVKKKGTDKRIPRQMVLDSSDDDDEHFADANTTDDEEIPLPPTPPGTVSSKGMDRGTINNNNNSHSNNEENLGAIAVRGMGRNGMGASARDEQVSFMYHNGSSKCLTTASVSTFDKIKNNNEENLIVAELAEPAEVVEGTPIDMTQEEMEENYQQSIQKQKRKTYVLFGFVLVIVVGIFLGIFLSLSKRNKELTFEPTEMATLVPTTSPTTEAPTTSPTTTMNSAISLLSPYIPNIPNGTHQEQALNWILENDDGFIQNQDADRLLDRYVLAVLYYATGGRQWFDKRNWISKFSVCTWSIEQGFGFVCGDNNNGSNDENQGDGRVRRIILPFNNLQGSIPTELGTLTELEELWLDENQLISTIPTEFGNLKNLTWLRLQRNDLTGNIPSEIGHLTKLTRLALHENSLSGKIPVEIEQLSNLETLRLGDSNQYEHPVPDPIVILCDGISGFTCDGFFETASPTASPAPTAYCSGAYFDLRLTLDSCGHETSWDIQDDEGNITYTSPIYGGGGDGTAGITIHESGCLDEGFYTFNLYDSFGDGLIDPGSYELTIGGVVALSGGYNDFGNDLLSVSFPVPLILTPSPTTSPTISMHPTAFCPMSNRFQLNVTLDNFGHEVSWDIQNHEGDIVHQSPINGYPSGQSGFNVIEDGCLNDDGSYIFNLYDSFGDGIAAEDYDYEGFLGSYEFSVGGNAIIAADEGRKDLLMYYQLTQYFDVPSSNCPTTNIFELQLNLDGNGNQTSLDIKNEAGDKIFESPIGAYPDGISGSISNHIERGCLPDGSYNFTLYDTYGDGLSLCDTIIIDDYDYDYGYNYRPEVCGSYELLIGGNVVVNSSAGEEFGHFLTVQFDVPYQVDDLIID